MKIVAESLECPDCGAPLFVQGRQRLAICVYCNASLRIESETRSRPTVNRLPEVPTDVIDEVKQLLAGGFMPEAVRHYREKSGASQDEALGAITGMQKLAIGYMPAANNFRGWFNLVSLPLVSLLFLGWGIVWMIKGWSGPGLIAIAAAALFAGMYWMSFGSFLEATLLLHRGRSAEAVVLKTWTIKPLVSKKKPGQLVRLLIEVRPEGQPVFRAETCCGVSNPSLPKIQAGSTVWVKYNPRNPKKLVVARVGTIVL